MKFIWGLVAVAVLLLLLLVVVFCSFSDDMDIILSKSSSTLEHTATPTGGIPTYTHSVYISMRVPLAIYRCVCVCVCLLVCEHSFTLVICHVYTNETKFLHFLLLNVCFSFCHRFFKICPNDPPPTHTHLHKHVHLYNVYVCVCVSYCRCAVVNRLLKLQEFREV